jgi:LuxR family maltose regulon positive regulatory protein
MREPASPVEWQARVIAARAYLGNAAPARAASLLGAVHEHPGAGTWAHVEAWLTEALAADELDHHGMVTIALAEAMSAAAPELLGPFLAAGEPLARLLHRHRDLAATRGPFADRLLTALHERAGEPPRNGKRLPQPITPREEVVLQFLPTLLTTDDIAAELSVSPNTIKTHLRNIYRKLSVNTRRDAVHRARTAGLLHPDRARRPRPPA